MLGSTAYPAAIDTDAELIRVVDGVYGGALILAEAVGAGADVLPVTAQPGVMDRLPVSGVVTVRGEHIGYAAKTATTLTGCAPTRGLFPGDGGAPAADHPAGTPVEVNVIAAHRRVATDAIKALETRLGPGANPAQSGHVRASNNAWLTARDVFNAADVNLIRAATDNRVELAGGAAVFDPARGLVLPRGLWLPPDVLALRDHFMGGAATLGQVGALGWSFASGTAAYLGAERGAPGIFRIAASAQNVPVHLFLQTINAREPFDLAFRARLTDNDANTGARFGLSADWGNGAPAHGIYLEKLQGADTQWYGVARTTSTQTRTPAMGASGTGWTLFRVRRVDAATVAFSVNGGPEELLSTTVPGETVSLSPGCHIYRVSTVAKVLDVDWFGMVVPGLGT